MKKEFINIEQERQGFLSHIKSEGLDVAKYESILKDFNEYLNEFNYTEVEKVSFEYYSTNNHSIKIHTENYIYSIDLPNYISQTREFGVFEYSVIVETIMLRTIGEIKIWQQVNEHGYERNNHDPETDHIYYLLKTLKKFIK